MSEVKELPILFSAPMIRAILNGTKTQTRRIVKPQPPAGFDRGCWFDFPVYGWTNEEPPTDVWHKAKFRYGEVGDRLWVRETHSISPPLHRRPISNPAGYPDVKYKATDLRSSWDDGKWTPSIHMKRVNSRIDLEVVKMWVERLNDISEADAIAEGVRELPLQKGEPGAWWTGDVSKGDKTYSRTPIAAYRKLWEIINGTDSWKANPWVWCISFRRVV